MRKVTLAFSSMIIVALFFLLTACGDKNQKKEKKSIAYVGRYSDINSTEPVDNRFDRMHEYMLKDYLTYLNASNPNYELQLLPFDCKRSPEETKKVYEQIAADTNIIAVIDNTWGVHIAGAVQTIKDNNIPVVAINADHNYKDFGTQAIFTGNNDMLPAELSTYIRNGMDISQIVFVSEEDYLLHETYVSEFKKQNINTAATFLIRNDATDKAAAFDSLTNTIKSAFAKDSLLKKKLIVINLHNEYGTKLLNYFDQNFKNLKMIGHAYITQTLTAQVFGKFSGNELILVNNPTDNVPKKIAQDMIRFKKENADVFQKLSSPMFPKRCLDATSIVQTFFVNAGGLYPNKTNMATYFSSLRDTCLRTETDLLQFNTHNDLTPDLYYVKYKEGRLYSLREQLNSKRKIIPNLVAGMEMIDLYNIDVGSNTFMADFYYWIKSDTADKDAEKYVLFPNMKEEGSASSLVLESSEEGQHYKLFKVSGLFHQDFNLKNYPFDKQEVVISMEIMAPSEKLKIAFDQSAFKQDTNLLEKFKVRAWEKDNYLLTVDNRISSTMRGNPESKEGELKKFQVFSLRLFLTRVTSGPMLEIILPLMLIGLVAISLLFVRNISFSNVGEVSVGTFLAIITFSIAIASVSPASDYLTKSDILFWLTFGVVLCCFLTIIVVNAVYDDRQAKNLPIVRKIRVVLIVSYLTSCFAVIYS